MMKVLFIGFNTSWEIFFHNLRKIILKHILENLIKFYRKAIRNLGPRVFPFSILNIVCSNPFVTIGANNFSI